MVSPRHYTVDPMLSASGNLFKCHEEVLFIFLPVVLLFLYSRPGVFCLSGGGDSFLFIFLKTIPVVLVFLYSIPGEFCLFSQYVVHFLYMY